MITHSDLARQVEYALLPLLIALPRLLAACSVMPLVGSAVVPITARITIILSLALFMHPLHSTTLLAEPLGPALWVAIVIKEMLIGFCIGFVCSIYIWVIEGIGSLLDTIVGNNNLFLFNPMLNQESGPFSILLGQVGAVLFIAFGGFIVLLHTLFASFVGWPVLSFFPSFSVEARVFLIKRSADVLATAVQLAMPVLTVLMLIDLGLGLLNRSASQLNAYHLSMPIKALAATLFLALTFVFMGDTQGPLPHLLEFGRALLRLNF